MVLQLTAALPNNAIFNTNSSGLFGVSWLQNDGWGEGVGMGRGALRRSDEDRGQELARCSELGHHLGDPVLLLR